MAKLYFAYGSNLSQTQMKARCPNSTVVGRAVLLDYLWQINERGYANVVPRPGSSVHGVVYSVDTADEKTLDRCEGVAIGAYEKEMANVVLYRQEPTPVVASALVYLSTRFVQPGPPRDEYIERINDGVCDAVALGVPMAFFDNAVRPFVPAPHEHPTGQVDGHDSVVNSGPGPGSAFK